MRHTLAILSLTTAVFATACIPFGVQARDGDDARRIADLMLEAQVEMNGVPGMSAAVASEGRIVWEGAAGFRDLERNLPATPETSYRFASVSKLLTATAAVKLMDESRFDPAAPVQDLVSGLNEDWPAISAQQLAAHISGLPHYQAIDAGRGGERYRNIEDAVRVFSNRSLLSTPGTRYHYSSWAYTLLSAAVEEAADEPFLDYVDKAVVYDLAIGPDLGTSDDRASLAYEFRNGAIQRAGGHDYSYSWGGAGYRGTAPALALFGDRVLSERFLSASARQFMWTPATYTDGTPVSARDFEVGFGWRIGEDRSGRRIVHHSGSAIGARSSLVVYPEQHHAVSVLSNAGWVASIDQTAAMLAAPFLIEDDAPVTRCPTETTRYEGTFGTDAVSGVAHFAIIDGLCQGRLTVDNAAGDWFNSFIQSDASELRVFALRANAGLGTAALVTPSGIYDFRIQHDGSYRARMTETVSLTVTLGDTPDPE